VEIYQSIVQHLYSRILAMFSMAWFFVGATF